MKELLLITTGGTIASGKTSDGLVPHLSAKELFSYIPEYEGICRVEFLELFNIDSTNVQPYHWIELAKNIEENYERYDGFIICHGTDTLAYTAAALSYLVQNTAKPIVLTGSQKPISEDNTDARTNLLDSLRYACSGDSGIVIVFGGHVIAGTRARKQRTKSYNAFTSINFPDVANVLGERVIRYIPYQGEREVKFYDELNSRVFLLKLTPGMPKEVFSATAELYDGLVIESYGVGGIPDIYLEEIEALVKMGKTIIMATQVSNEGSDIKVYRVGQIIKKKYNLLETYDMTLESTVTKLMWVLGQTNDDKEIRRLFCTCINHDLLY